MSENLDRFGALLMTDVRDRVINNIGMMLRGEMNSKKALEWADRYKTLDENGKDFASDLVVEAVDRTICEFMELIDGNNSMDMLVRDDATEEYASLRELSDGLAGELFTEDGWIYRFSRNKTNY